MDILLGIVSNCIYGGIVRISTFLGKRIRTKKLKNDLEKEIRTKFTISNSNINYDSLAEFFSMSQIKDTINNYLLYKTTYIQKTKFKPANGKQNFYDINSIIEILQKKYAVLYDLSDVYSQDIKECIEFIVSFCEEKIFNLLKKNEKATIYFINSHTEEYYNLLDQRLKIILDDLNKSLNKNLEKQNTQCDSIRDKYHKILKERNSEAHIYLLDKFSFNKFYVPPTLIKPSKSKIEELELIYNESSPFTSWDKIFLTSNIVYVIGGAGYGKSLFLRKIINDYIQLAINDPNEYLVVYGELKMFYKNNSDTPVSVDDFLINSIKISTLLGDEITLEFIHHYLNMGRCLILLDALDEVDKNKRPDLHEKVIAYFKNQNPNNKICITSRDRGFIPEKKIEVFQIRPLSVDEIDKYVDNIIKLRKFDRNDKVPFMMQASKLADQGFLNSFLVLSLLLNIYKAELELPENKLDLYSKCFEYITVKREKEKTTDGFDWSKINILMKDNTFMALAQLCYPNNKDVEKDVIVKELTKIYKTKYSNENETENAVEEFLRFCSDRTELFVPSSSDDKFKFFHRSFFEYFYALHLFVDQTSPQELINKFKEFDVDSEIFELTMSMLKQRAENKYQNVLDIIINEAEGELIAKVNPICLNILILIMQIVDDIQYKEKFFELIIKYKESIMQNIENIHNLSYLPIFLRGFPNYQIRICETYYRESINELINRLAFIMRNYAHLKDFLGDSEVDMWFERRSRFYNRNALFYYELFIKKEDLFVLLNSLDDNQLKDIGILKKKQLNYFNNFKTLTIDEQKSILKYIKE